MYNNIAGTACKKQTLLTRTHKHMRARVFFFQNVIRDEILESRGNRVPYVKRDEIRSDSYRRVD